MNANLLQRWVSEFRRHGKHDLADLDVTPAPDEGRHIAAANWIPVDGPAKTVGAQVATRVVTIVDAPRPAASPSNTTHQTVGLEVSSSDLRLTLHWLSDDPHGLAGFVRELLR